jgi:hypothetical protein
MTMERKLKVHMLLADQIIDSNENMSLPRTFRSKRIKATYSNFIPVTNTFLAGIWPPTGRTSMERYGCRVRDKGTRVILVKH